MAIEAMASPKGVCQIRMHFVSTLYHFQIGLEKEWRIIHISKTLELAVFAIRSIQIVFCFFVVVVFSHRALDAGEG